MNNIGIAGFGKMGRDIFNLFLANPDISHITVFCRHDIEAYTEKMQKELAKSLKRKKLTQEQFNEKSENTRFTENIADLSECDIIIESITENLFAKQEFFQQLYNIAKTDCILATNTSSLSVSDIFADCPNPERCMGMHFFYPVKFSEFVELNVLSETGTEQIEKIKDFLQISGKKSIVFSGCYHIFLNQIINYAISLGISLYNENEMSMKQMQEIFSELFPMHGIFGLIDGIGLNLLANNKMKNCCKRLESVMDYGTRQMKQWLDDGCSGEPNRFFDTFRDKPFTEISDSTKQSLIEYVKTEIERRTAEISAEYGGEPQLLIDAVKSTLGFAENI